MPTTLTDPIAVSAEIEAALADLRRMIGTERAEATIVYGLGRPQIRLELWPSYHAPGGEIGRTQARATVAEMVVEAREMIAASAVTRRNAMVRRLALAIIEITDEHTRCTRALLRAKEFSDPEIDEFQLAACQRASEMCANAPFRVEAD